MGTNVSEGPAVFTSVQNSSSRTSGTEDRGHKFFPHHVTSQKTEIWPHDDVRTGSVTLRKKILEKYISTPLHQRTATSLTSERRTEQTVLIFVTETDQKVNL